MTPVQPTTSIHPVDLSRFLRIEATMGPKLPGKHVCRHSDHPTPRPLAGNELVSPANALAEDRCGQSARFERLARLRAQIVAGTYHVSAADLADSLIHKLQSATGQLQTENGQRRPEPNRNY